jgi:OmpA-OmpF porin, OOP family
MILRLITIFVSLFFVGSVYADPADYTAVMAVDAKGAADSEYTGRYEGSTIVGQTFQKFNEVALPAGPTENLGKVFAKNVTLQGSIQRTLYVSPEERSSLDVFSNYLDAIKAKGFEPVFECANEACGVGFTALKYKGNDASKVVVSVDAETRRVALSRGMFIKILDPRYALLKKGAAGQETYLAIFAAQNAGGSMGDISKALKSRVGVLIEVVEP